MSAIELVNGICIPKIGLGTWRSPSSVVLQAVKDAIDIGYRHIDCAHIYGNEREVGQAIVDKICEGVLKREDIFITSKLWNTYHHPSMVRDACVTSIKNLQTNYLDCYLMHWPMAFKDGDDLYPKDENGKTIFSDVDYIDTWRAMEQLVRDGLCKTIGISNFNESQIVRLLSVAKIPPVILQIESHPYLTQKSLMKFCYECGITVTAYSPLGSSHTPYKKPGEYILLKHPKVLEIANKYNRTPAQILICFQTQRGNVVIPRSVTKEHILANFNSGGLKISDEDMLGLENLNINDRIMKMESAAGHIHHPFDNV